MEEYDNKVIIIPGLTKEQSAIFIEAAMFNCGEDIKTVDDAFEYMQQEYEEEVDTYEISLTSYEEHNGHEFYHYGSRARKDQCLCDAVWNETIDYKAPKIRNIDNEIENIDAEINALKIKRKNLVTERIESVDTFEEKFKHWYLKCETKNHSSDIPSDTIFPALRKWIAEHEFSRHQTIDVSDEFLYQIFENIFEEECREDNFRKNLLTQEELDHYINMAKEIMDNNLGSFTIDW